MAVPTSRIEVRLLGPLEVLVDGRQLSVPGPKLRAIVAQLALAGGRVVSAEELMDGTWGEDLPSSARNTLQYHVSLLRKALATHDAADFLVTRDPGYSLVATTDVARFHAAQAEATAARGRGDMESAAARYADALNEWRAAALAGLRDFAFAESRAVALESLRVTCLEAWADAELACGRADAMVGPLQEMVSENPVRERLWELMMVALYRTGRQDAALAAYRSARATFDRELGVAPSQRLRDVHEAILRHDPKLAPVPALKSVVARAVSTTRLSGPLRAATPTLIGPSGRQVELGSNGVVIGRHADCDLVLADEQASRRHAKVVRSPTGYAVADMDSTNGTYLNGTMLTAPAELADGDRIEIGHSVIRFVYPVRR